MHRFFEKSMYMSQLSKRKLKDEVSKQLFELTFSLLGRRKDRGDFQNTLFAILSPSEQLVIAKRIAILYLLIKKIDYAIIRDVLKVSTSTVSKCVMILENSENLSNTLKILVQSNQIKDIFLEAFSEFYSPGTYGVNWKTASKIKKEVERKKREGI